MFVRAPCPTVWWCTMSSAGARPCPSSRGRSLSSWAWREAGEKGGGRCCKPGSSRDRDSRHFSTQWWLPRCSGEDWIWTLRQPAQNSPPPSPGLEDRSNLSPDPASWQAGGICKWLKIRKNWHLKREISDRLLTPGQVRLGLLAPTIICPWLPSHVTTTDTWPQQENKIKKPRGEIVQKLVYLFNQWTIYDNGIQYLRYNRDASSPMGLDVALEEINHLLEADMSDANRNVFKGIYLSQ